MSTFFVRSRQIGARFMNLIGKFVLDRIGWRMDAGTPDAFFGAVFGSRAFGRCRLLETSPEIARERAPGKLFRGFGFLQLFV
jgi:hypothetical protein